MVTIYGRPVPSLKLPPTPDWLQRHGGELRPDLNPQAAEVWLDGQPLYRLEVRPAWDRYSCAVVDMTNGQRLDDPHSVYPTADEALRGGLEQLRTRLGW
jgi:hypothetical protein